MDSEIALSRSLTPVGGISTGHIVVSASVYQVGLHVSPPINACLNGIVCVYASRDLSLDHGVAPTFVSVAVASREKLESGKPSYTRLFMRFLMRSCAYLFNISKSFRLSTDIVYTTAHSIRDLDRVAKLNIEGADEVWTTSTSVGRFSWPCGFRQS